MILLVTGDRNWKDRYIIKREIQALNPTLVRHGAAPGADSLAEDVCRELGIPTDPMPANWAIGNSAGPQRNKAMYLKDPRPDFVLGFHLDIQKSKGTKGMLNIVKKGGTPWKLVDSLKLYPDAQSEIVPGDGPKDADIMIIGEAPGANEDEHGVPFVGRAGELLNSTLASHGIERADCYVTNLVKCRPPGNRRPTDDEIRAHSDMFVAEYKEIMPKAVLLLGNTVLHALTDITDGITGARGPIPSVHHPFTMKTFVYATVHPSAALRSKSTLEMFNFDIKTFSKLSNVHTPDRLVAAS